MKKVQYSKSKGENILRRLISYFKQQEIQTSRQEIDESWDAAVFRADTTETKAKPHTVRTILLVAACAASVILVFIFTKELKIQDSESDITTIASRMDTGSNTYNEIQLIVSSNKVIQVETGSTVTYLSDGSIEINEEKVEAKDGTDIEDDYNQIIVPNGKHIQLLLSDGSRLHVNAGTKILYPRNLKKDKREIYVDGEVYLDVKKDDNAQFIVKTANFDVKVLGTAFNISAYKNETLAEVVLLRGAVEIKDLKQQSVQLQPNQLIAINNGVIGEKKNVNATDYIAWTNGLLILNTEPLENLFRKLHRYYGKEIKFDSASANITMIGKLDMNSPLEGVMRRISFIVPIKYEEKQGIYYVTTNN